MGVTKQDLQDFNQFAIAKLANGGADSLPDLVIQWQASRYPEEVNAAVRRGLAEADAGLGKPLDEFIGEFRENNSVSPDA